MKLINKNIILGAGASVIGLFVYKKYLEQSVVKMINGGA